MDVVLLPASTALVRLAPPSFWLPPPSVQTEAAARRGASFRAPAGAGQLLQRLAGHCSRASTRCVQLDRPLPHGLGPALTRWTCSATRSTRSHLRPRQPAQPPPGARGAPAARARVPDGRTGARPFAGASCWKATRPRAPLYLGHGRGRGQRRHRVLPAAVLRETATIFDYLGNEATVVLHGDVDEAIQRFWADTATATAWLARP